jgi:hypothetical protein
VRARLVALVLLGVTVPASNGLAATAWLDAAPVATLGMQLLGPTVPVDSLGRVYIVGRLSPGASVRRRVEITNTGRRPALVSVYPAAASVEHGRFGFAPGSTPDELSRWTALSTRLLRVPPRGRRFETVTVRVPRRVSSGERYAVVWAQVSARAPLAGGVTLVDRVGVRMYISIAHGNEGAASFAIGSVHAERSPTGRPSLAASVRNNGQQTLELNGSVTLFDGPEAFAPDPSPLKSLPP